MCVNDINKSGSHTMLRFGIEREKKGIMIAEGFINGKGEDIIRHIIP